MEWARETLAPFIEEVPASQGAFNVEAIFADEDDEESITLPTGQLDLQPLFLGRVAAARSADGLRDLVDVQNGVHYRVAQNSVRIRYRTPSSFLAHEPARIIREALAAQVASDGWCRMHAAAVAVDGRGILVVGGPGSGKSSTVVQMLARGASYIANDRLLVRAAPDGNVMVRGLPIAVRWSAAQLHEFASGPDFIRCYETHSRLQRSDLKAGFRKYELTLPEVAAISGAPMVTEASVAAVVLPRRRGDEPGVVARAQHPGLADELAEHFLPVDPAFPPFFLLQPTEQRQVERLINSAAIALARLPGYVLGGTHDDHAVAQELLWQLRR
jgi:hypothetical protein